MKISVIVPIYNVEKYLRFCIDSILKQDYDDYEIILIDDGSTDSSPNICQEYEWNYSNIKYYRKLNGGLSSARNFGLNRASGEWVIFIDSDDYWTSTKCLATLFSVAQRCNSEIVRFEYTAVDENNFFLYEHPIDRKRTIYNRSISSYEMFHTAIAGEFFAVLYMFKKTILEDISFDEGLTFQEDVNFIMRLFALKNLTCSYIPDRFYAYRKRDKSITTTPNIRNIVCSFAMCDDFYKYSLVVKDNKLAQEYRYYSVLKYYRTLASLAENPYFSNCTAYLKEIRLAPLYKRTIVRMFNSRIFKKFSIFVLIPPLLSVILIRLKHFINTVKC